MKFFVLVLAFFSAFGASRVWAQINYTSTSYCPTQTNFVVTEAETSYYLATSNATTLGACGVNWNMFDQNHYAAIDPGDWENGAACGACAALNYKSGSTTVMIVDECGTCGSDSYHLDLAPQAYGELVGSTGCVSTAGSANGSVNTGSCPAAPGANSVTWHFIQCPLTGSANIEFNNSTGNITYEFKDGSGSNSNFYPVVFWDTLFPIQSVQLSTNSGGSWTAITRDTSGGIPNFWGSSSEPTSPTSNTIEYAIKDDRGNSVTIGPIGVSPIMQANNASFVAYGTTSGQLPGCVTGPTNTPTYTPTVGSPTGTPTHTLTVTPTPTITPISGCPFYYYSGTSPHAKADFNTSTGVNGTSSSLTESTAAALNGETDGLDFQAAVTADGYYAGMNLNWANYSGTAPLQPLVNLANYSSLQFYIENTTAAESPMTLTVDLADYEGGAAYTSKSVTFVVTGTGPTVETFPLSDFSTGGASYTTTNIGEIDILVQPSAAAQSINLYIGSIAFYGTCPTSTFTPTKTATNTATSAFTSTFTPTQTPIPGCEYMYYDGTAPHAVTNAGTVGISAGGTASLTENTTAALNGYTDGMDFQASVTALGYYAQLRWNWAGSNASPGPPDQPLINLNNFTTLEFYIEDATAADSPMTLTVTLDDYSGAQPSAGVTESSAPVTIVLTGTGSNRIDLPTSDFAASVAGAGNDYAVTDIGEIDFEWLTSAAAQSANIYIDGIGFYGTCPTNTPTSTDTSTATKTYTVTPTNTATTTPTSTSTATKTVTTTPTVTPSNTPNSTSTSTGTTTATYTITTTATPTKTYTTTSTSTPTQTNTVGNTSTDTATVSATQTSTNTATHTATGTSTNTFTATITATPTQTLAGPTSTATVTPTKTDTASATATSTSTSTSGVETSTSTASSTSTNTVTRTVTATSTSTTGAATSTSTATDTSTNTPTHTVTATPTNTIGAATSTSTATTTATNTSTFTHTSSPTATSTSTIPNTPTNSATLTATHTATSTVTTTSTPTITNTNTVTDSPTITGTPTVTSTGTVNTPTVTSSPTKTWTSTSTSTASNTDTNTVTNTPTSTYTITPTDTATETATKTETLTTTSTPSDTVTSTSTTTSTPTTGIIPPTSTMTNTATSSTTNTPTDTATNTSTATITSTTTPTLTGTLPPTDTFTVTTTKTATSTSTNTATSSPTSTNTPTPSNTTTSTPTATSTITSTNSATATVTNTPIDTATPTNTPTNSPTITPTTTSTEVTVAASGSGSSSTQIPGASVTVEQVILTNPGNTVVTLSSLALYEPTTSTSGITSVWLVDNGVIISQAIFNGGQTATFNSFTSNNTIPANGGTVTYQVVVNFSTSAVLGTYPFSVTNLVGNNGQSVGFSSQSLIGATISIREATSTPTSTPIFTATPTQSSTPTPLLTTIVSQPFPNPASGPVSVTIQVPGTSTVNMEVFTAAFRKIFSLPPVQVTGSKTLGWDLRDNWGNPVADGLYYIRISVSGIQPTVKILKVLVIR